MQKEIDCTKIKDGLYLGNFKTSQDCQFLITNKFAYIINCSAQLPNFYEKIGIKYLKYKLIKNKHHQLWQNNNLKKLKKLEKFIDQCQQNSLCCLIHSYDGCDRSLVLLSGYFISKFKWSLSKTLEYFRSKKVFIGLSQHNIQQLEKLQNIIKIDHSLSQDWNGPYLSQQQQIISKTYINSLQLQQKKNQKIPKKQVIKRVRWQDKIDKEKQKQNKIHQNQNLSKVQNKHIIQNKKQGTLKNAKNLSLTKSQKSGLNKKQRKQLTQEGFKQEYQDQILKLIKNNLKKQKKQVIQQQPIQKDKIYNLTINNIIQPNISIFQGEKKKNLSKNRPKSACQKDQSKNNNPTASIQAIIKNNQKKKIKKNSPNHKQKEKKIDKSSSLQFKKIK